MDLDEFNTAIDDMGEDEVEQQGLLSAEDELPEAFFQKVATSGGSAGSNSKFLSKWLLVGLGILSLVVFVYQVVVAMVASSGYFNFGSAMDITNRHPTGITPAGYAFSIWGVIYTLQFCYCVWALVPIQQENLSRSTKAYLICRCSLFLPLGWFAQSLWAFLFGWDRVSLSFLCIAGAWLTFFIVYVRLFTPVAALERLLCRAALFRTENGEGDGALFVDGQPLENTAPLYGLLRCLQEPRELMYGAAHYFLVYLPTALNAGWLTVAALVNMVMFLKGDGMSVSNYAYDVLLLMVTLLAGAMTLVSAGDFGFAAAVLWGLFAAFINDEIDYDAMYTPDYLIVWVVCLSIICTCGAMARVGFTLRRLRSSTPSSHAPQHNRSLGWDL